MQNPSARPGIVVSSGKLVEEDDEGSCSSLSFNRLLRGCVRADT